MVSLVWWCICGCVSLFGSLMVDVCIAEGVTNLMHECCISHTGHRICAEGWMHGS